jgi:hypothetical protein
VLNQSFLRILNYKKPQNSSLKKAALI